MKGEFKYKNITERIIGASFEVHKFLGNGITHFLMVFENGIRQYFVFQEVIFKRAIAWEFTQCGLSFEREIVQQIFYKDLPGSIGTRRADFVVNEKICEISKTVEICDFDNE